jgi:hypothetical protein
MPSALLIVAGLAGLLVAAYLGYLGWLTLG